MTHWCGIVSMAWQGFTVKPHYFAPLLKSTAGSGDMDGKHYTLCGLESFVYFCRSYLVQSCYGHHVAVGVNYKCLWETLVCKILTIYSVTLTWCMPEFQSCGGLTNLVTRLTWWHDVCMWQLVVCNTSTVLHGELNTHFREPCVCVLVFDDITDCVLVLIHYSLL